jgi:hypothetical protein
MVPTGWERRRSDVVSDRERVMQLEEDGADDDGGEVREAE